MNRFPLLCTIWLVFSPAIAAGAISQTPLILTQAITPQVMLTLSNDHQLYFPAYADHADLNDDGASDLTYIHSVDYEGYFDPDKCYDYDTSDLRFEPVSETVDKYCAGGVFGEWSGNFLNWASMSRIDIVRKVLYGGLRSADTSSATVLERSYIPTDSHSWVKYYAGNDLDDLTPFSVNSSFVTANSGSTNTIDDGHHDFTHNFLPGEVREGDQIIAIAPGDKGIRGYVETVNPGEIRIEAVEIQGEGESFSAWTLVNLTRRGLSICNTTNSNAGFSQSSTDPPLMRIAYGDYGLWTANETVQCRWDEEDSKSFGDVLATTGLSSSLQSPVRAEVGLGEDDYVVRASVCAPTLLESNCSQYPDGNYKPTGLLQTYGEGNDLHFGLLTGSYLKNKSGGVLRKNIGPISNEIDPDDGVFLSAPAEGSIIKTLDLFRIYGYSNTNRNYSNSGSEGDNCDFDHTRQPTGAWSDGQCTNWGNPQSEIFLEALRYFAGQGETSDFTFSGDDKIAGLETASWTDPLDASNYCAQLNILNFTASNASFDNDQLSGAADLNTSLTAAEMTSIVGEGEGIHGKDWFVGENGSVVAGDDAFQICTSKLVDDLGAVEGTCPESPKSDGSFQVAGLAHFAYTNDIRSDLTDDQSVKTYGVTLSSGIPEIKVIDPDNSARAVTILPACRDHRMTPPGSCSLVNFKIIEEDTAAGTGSYFIQWEASASGGDYDQDMIGILRYVADFDTDEISVTTDVIGQSSDMVSPFGYTISGTLSDGFHAHSGVNNYDFDDPGGLLGCVDCVLENGPTSVTYEITGSSAGILETPLFYASKWGGYLKGSSDYTFPDDVESWDSDNDGNPDNYFPVSNPSALEGALGSIFTKIAEKTSSSSAVATNSTRLDTDTMLFQARYRSVDWTGELLAFNIEIDGDIGTQAWNAADLIPAAGSRDIFTWDSANAAGVNFTWGAIPSAQQALLNLDESGTLDNLGSDRLDYIRGVRSEETSASGPFRTRESVLGDIVNSDPLFVGKASFGFSNLPSPEGPAYEIFRSSDAFLNRPPMLYVGANDGMLHGFNATTGVEEFAFVPNAVVENLSQLTGVDYGSTHQFFVDGSPRYLDAYIDRGTGDAWRTVLVSGLGAGGRSIFAMDVTDPSTLTASSVMWEYTEADLGYTFSQPTVVRLALNDTWAVVFGNGYGGASGEAFLYVVNLETGALIRKIPTGYGDAATPNGLSTPVPVDVNQDSITDYVYAGDLLGNLWKFDLTHASNSSNWSSVYKSGSDPEPLFKARDPLENIQPITARPIVREHDSQTGHMVFFGTGKFYETGDNDVSGGLITDTFYGIWDDGVRITATDRSVLQPQQITHQTTLGTFDVRVVSNNLVNWGTRDGWYLDLLPPDGTQEGERVVGQALLRHGRVIFPTLIPSTHPCDFGGTTWLMELSAMDGGRLDDSVFDLNGDGLIDASDFVTLTDGDGNEIQVPVSGIKIGEGVADTPGIISAGNVEYKYLSNSSGDIEVVKEAGGGADTLGRRSWRQLR